MIPRLPKGFKDFSPEESLLFKKIRNTLEEVFEDFGFFPLITPIVEYYDVLKGKYNDESEEKEMWVFNLKKSDKFYALKYDQTVPLARYFSMNLPKIPFKRYTIDRSFRHENPQKGRYREFWQADVDIIGSEFEESDAEIINLLILSLRKLGFYDFKLKISDRKALEKVILKYGNNFEKIARIIDKWDKIGEEGVINELKKYIDNPEKLINEIKENKEDYYDERFWRVIDLVEYKKYIDIDLKLARGFDYYTSTIFEVWTKFPRAIGGGGRYDNLIGIFLNKKIPAVGGSLGINALIDAGIELKVFKLPKKELDVGIIVLNQKLFKIGWKICNKLREYGYKTYIDLKRRNFKKQMEYLLDFNVKYLVIVGENDIKENKVTLQNRITKNKIKVDIENLLKNPNILNEV